MEEVTLGVPALETITLPATKEHKATVVFLHGLGDTGRGLSQILGDLDLPHVKWVFPSAPVAPVSVNRGSRCPSWYDVIGLSEGDEDDVAGIDKAARYIASILKREKASSPEGTKLIVGGLSQGGALSLHLAVRKHLGKFVDGSDAAAVPLDGTICLSGWLPMKADLLGKASASSKGACCWFPRKKNKTLEGQTSGASAYPLLLCHGKADFVVNYSRGRIAADTLESLGFASLTFKTYGDLGHSVFPEELQDVQQWLSLLL